MRLLSRMIEALFPLGWEDADGFHLGVCPPERDQHQPCAMHPEGLRRRVKAGVINNLNHNGGITAKAE